MKTDRSYEIVKESIDKFDVFGFLETGAPADEYDPEIKSIVKQLNRCNSVIDISHTISRVFNSYFSNRFHDSFFNEQAEYIYQKLKSDKLI